MIEILISPKSRDELALCASFLLTVSAQASSMLEEGSAKSAPEPKARGTKDSAESQDPGTAVDPEPAKPASEPTSKPATSQQVDHSPDQVLHEVYENKAPAAKPEPEPEAPATTPEYNADQVRDACRAFASEQGIPELHKVLARFGVRKVMDLKPEQYPEMMAAVKG